MSKRHHNKQSELPSGYTRLQYIESTGTQYITISGYSPTSSAIVKIEYKKSEEVSTVFQAGKNSNRIMMLLSNVATRIDYCFGNGYKIATVLNGDNDIGVWYDAEIKYNSLKIGSNVYTLLGSSNVQASTDLNLFHINWGDGRAITTYSYALSFLSIEDTNGNINLIPALRNSDSKPGLYDTVNGVFYTNQGTGEFLYA